MTYRSVNPYDGKPPQSSGQTSDAENAAVRVAAAACTTPEMPFDTKLMRLVSIDAAA